MGEFIGGIFCALILIGCLFFIISKIIILFVGESRMDDYMRITGVLSGLPVGALALIGMSTAEKSGQSALGAGMLITTVALAMWYFSFMSKSEEQDKVAAKKSTNNRDIWNTAFDSYCSGSINLSTLISMSPSPTLFTGNASKIKDIADFELGEHDSFIAALTNSKGFIFSTPNGGLQIFKNSELISAEIVEKNGTNTYLKTTGVTGFNQTCDKLALHIMTSNFDNPSIEIDFVYKNIGTETKGISYESGIKKCQLWHARVVGVIEKNKMKSMTRKSRATNAEASINEDLDESTENMPTKTKSTRRKKVS